jgi:hypothetical protein
MTPEDAQFSTPHRRSWRSTATLPKLGASGKLGPRDKPEDDTVFTAQHYSGRNRSSPTQTAILRLSWPLKIRNSKAAIVRTVEAKALTAGYGVRYFELFN